MRRFTSWLRLWFTFERSVSRREYLASGLALGALKYAGDVLIVWYGTGRIWHILDYLSPASSLAEVKLAGAPPEMLPVLALWSLPFLWIGISMSMRRALDAGYSAWSALLFFVPGANYVFMGVMSVLPQRALPRVAREDPRAYEHRLPSALLAIATGAIVGFGMIALSTFGIERYGVSLFLGMPFVVGALTAFLFNRRYPASGAETQQVVQMTLAFMGGVTLLTAAEGALCLLMAAPLAIGIGAMGSVFGRWIALRDRRLAHAMMAVVMLPTSALLEPEMPASPLREVRSAIVIDASSDVVWRHVLSFSPLPEPDELTFRMGIAYPRRAHIVGEGVGAVRYCEFSTGPFVEPITHWEPGRRLSFDVAEQPLPMHEWSPYADITPPHLDGYIRSRRGEFRLVALPDGRTRLEGSTWYEMQIAPAAYWSLFGDAIIHTIHDRVLEHIERSAEGEVANRLANRLGSESLVASR